MSEAITNEQSHAANPALQAVGTVLCVASGVIVGLWTSDRLAHAFPPPDGVFLIVSLVLLVLLWIGRRFFRNLRLSGATSFAQTALIVFVVVTPTKPIFDESRSIAYVAGMKSDLKNLEAAQGAFFSDSAKYTTTLDTLSFATSYGVIGPSITLTPDGWQAMVSHEGTSQTCAIFVGSSALTPAVQEGYVACTPAKKSLGELAWLALAFVMVAIGTWIRAAPGATASRDSAMAGAIRD